MTYILEACNLHYSYSDGPKALKGLSLGLEEGKKVALVGPNGAGKSTLMLAFNGVIKPAAGEVRFRGEPLKYDSRSLRDVRRKVGMVFQNPDDQLFAPTVRQDVAFGPLNLGYPKEKVGRYVDYALSYVGLSGYEDRPPHHLSGGEKRRVAIAGVLAMEPEVMILDEPTSNLDPASAEEIMEMLDELSCGGKTMIVSTHDVELAYRWADEVVLMEGGKLLHRGPASKVFSDQELVLRARVKAPLILEIYRELSIRRVLNGSNPPKNILELADMVETKAKGSEALSKSKADLGCIKVFNVDTADPSEAEAISKTVDCVGAMGTNAKTMAEREKIPLDFTYGVIDKCILKAIAGKSSLIMTSGGMVEHTLKRIRDYGVERGREIQVTLE